MELNWKSNKVYPDEGSYSIFAVSKAYGFFGELYYQNDNFHDEENFEPYLENDEGYFKIPWSKVDHWMTYEDFVKEIAPEISDKEFVEKEQKKRHLEEIEQEKKETEEAFKDFDKTQTFNIVVLEEQAETYSELKYPKIFEFSDQIPTSFAKSYDNQKQIEFTVKIGQYNEYFNINVDAFDTVCSTVYYRFIISNKKSTKDLKKIIIKDYMENLLNRISDNEKQIEVYNNFIQILKEL